MSQDCEHSYIHMYKEGKTLKKLASNKKVPLGDFFLRVLMFGIYLRIGPKTQNFVYTH